MLDTWSLLVELIWVDFSGSDEVFMHGQHIFNKIQTEAFTEPFC